MTPTVVSIRTPKATYPYGVTEFVPLRSAVSAALVQIGMPRDIPTNAVVVSAQLVFVQYGAQSGSVSWTIRRNLAKWAVSKATWTNSPSVGGTTITVTKSSSAAGTLWVWDVTADVQGFVDGTLTNNGWRLASTTATGYHVRGTTTAAGKPYLVIEYLIPGQAPTDLSPDGGQAVSVAKPTLLFTVSPDTSSIQVQIDTAMDGVTPDFDSGTVAAVAGELSLASTAYAGLSVAATTYWRARSTTPLGVTAWSDWAEFTRVAKPTATITSPGTTTDDSTPPITWTASGQVSWQVIVRNAAGAVVANSGRTVGSETSWTPPAAVVTEGASATAELRIWDAVDRIGTPGDPVYAVDTQTFTLSSTPGVAGPTTSSATVLTQPPGVLLQATRTSVPDGWAVIRDGVRIYRSDVASGSFSWTDWGASPNHSHVYRIAPIVNGEVSSNGTLAAVTPRVTGVWLIDPETGDAAVLWGQDAGTWEAPEQTAIHRPVAGPPVRRVAYRGPYEGEISGDLMDVGTLLADDTIAQLYAFKSNPANHVYRFVIGDLNLPVTVGDILPFPTPDSSKKERLSRGSFSWVQVGEIAWES